MQLGDEARSLLAHDVSPESGAVATHSYERGGQPDGTTELADRMSAKLLDWAQREGILERVTEDQFRDLAKAYFAGLRAGAETSVASAHLTADRALEVAADLVAHADALRKPSETPSAPIMALIGNWQRQVAERRNLRDSMGTEGNRTYQAAYADGVDGCVHALKALLESRPADEDAMAEAQANPGRMVTMAPDIAKMAHLAESQGDPLRTIIP